MNGEDLTSVLRKIIENPEFAGMVSELRGEGNAADASQEMLSKLPDVMAMVSPMLDSGEKQEEAPSEEAAVPMGLKKYDKTRAEKLMAALKPYLNPTRCSMIDKCLSVMQIGDMMSMFGGIDGLMKRE